jgi:hypothetical protein
MESPSQAGRAALGHPLEGPEPASAHLSLLAAELAGAQLADPPDPRRVAWLAWKIFGELVEAAHAAIAAGVRLATAIAGSLPVAAGQPRQVRIVVWHGPAETAGYVIGLAAELAAASTDSPADPDRLAAVAWRILSTLGEATFACAAYLETLAQQFSPAAAPGANLAWDGPPASCSPVSAAGPLLLRSALVLGGS